MKNELTVFIVVGRLGKSLTVSKVQPFVTSKYIKKVYVFREEKGFPIETAEYITIPRYIAKIKPRFIQRPIRMLYEFFQLLIYSIKLRPDYINGVGVKPKGWNSAIVARLTSSKCIFSIIGGEVSITTYYKLNQVWKRINLMMIRNSAVVTTKGNALKKYLVENGIDEKKIYILNGSINIDQYKFDESIRKNIDILFVGAFRRLKGPDRVLQVIKHLKNIKPSLKAVFLGDGYMFKDISQKLSDEGLAENVQLLGYLDNPVPYFQKSKVIVMPSRSEGLPTAMLEAMACGCVPVVSDVGNVTDAAVHGKNAFVVNDYQDINTFAQCTKFLLSHEDIRYKMAIAGREFVEKHYSVVAQSEIVEKIITKTS